MADEWGKSGGGRLQRRWGEGGGTMVREWCGSSVRAVRECRSYGRSAVLAATYGGRVGVVRWDRGSAR